jgi:hypothetical protein
MPNVTDPSTGTVPADRGGVPFATATTDGFRIGMLLVRSHDGALPSRGADGGWPAGGFRTWRWPDCIQPACHPTLKPVFDSPRAMWSR